MVDQQWNWLDHGSGMNIHHHHWNFGLFMPAAVQSVAAGWILDQRRIVLEEAFALHSERYVRGMPRASRPAAEV